ncbi:hypothetical protein ACHAXR_006130 [Thalassiosira sp. AJA248-18]
MWRISLIPDGGNNIIPADDATEITSAVPMSDFLANSIYECETTGQLIHFYHATMGYPVTSTWCMAIGAGYFRGWPSLTSKRVRKFIKIVSEAEMGHIDQRKVGIRSTKVDTDPDSMEPVPQTPLNNKAHHVYMSIAKVEGRLYSNQTGRFPITSNRGNSNLSGHGTWDYHAIKAWYFAPALKHYRVVKGVLESGATRLTDTWKFKHHALPTPAISSTDRIVKATQNLAATIQVANPSQQDELSAIEHLRALISNSSVPAPSVSPTTVPTQDVPTYESPRANIATVPPIVHPIVPPVPVKPQHIFEPVLEQPIQATQFSADTSQQSNHPPAPAFISKDHDEPIEPRYHLRSRANIISSLIDPNLIPLREAHKYSRGLTAANHAVQVYSIARSVHEKSPMENFAYAILNEETGRSLEFRQLIKLDKYRDIMN